MEQKELTTQADPDWDNRVLCSDGRCTGIIGPDGRCGECRARYEGISGAVAPPSAPDAGITLGAGTGAAEPLSATADGVEPDWDNRVLCSDGNCIGVIGSDGRCKECGLPLKTDAAAAS